MELKLLAQQIIGQTLDQVPVLLHLMVMDMIKLNHQKE